MGIVEKICKDCGKSFLCPSLWRRTQWCEECSNKRNKHKKSGHRKSAELSKNARENGKPCEKCGAPGITYHHIVRLSDGGSQNQTNLVFLCRKCHEEIHFPRTAYRYQNETN